MRRYWFVISLVVAFLFACGQEDKTTTPTGVPQEGETPGKEGDFSSKEVCLDGRDPDARTNWCGGYYIFGNPYPCCCNNANCTWWAWYAAKMVWVKEKSVCFFNRKTGEKARYYRALSPGLTKR